MKRCKAGMIGVLALCTAQAHAGRPLVTEDADVLAPQACEWESMLARTKVGSDASISTGATQVGCGVGWNSQVAVAYGKGNGLQLLGVGGKTALITRQDDAAGLTLAWGLIGAKPEGASLRHDVSYLNLVLTKALGHELTGHANLGWTRSRLAGHSASTWNLAIEWAQRPGLDWMAEVYGDNRTKHWLGLGVRYAPSDRWSLNASVAQQRETPKVRLFTVGAKLSF